MTALLALCLTVTVHDADTIRCDGEKVRIANIDSPELEGSSRCTTPPRSTKNPPWCDHALGIQARDALRSFVVRGRVEIERQGVDRYGRTLARVYVNGQDAGEWLVSRGYARPWIQ